MTREQIAEAIREMDCLEQKEREALAGLLYEAREKQTQEAIGKAMAVIDWLYQTERITLINGLEMRDLI